MKLRVSDGREISLLLLGGFERINGLLFHLKSLENGAFSDVFGR